MNKQFVAAALTALLCCASSWAQMTFTFSGGATAKTTTLADGTVAVNLPASKALQGCITGVTVDGVTVDASAVVPNPTTTLITEGEIETFVYNNKAYSFRFYAGGYFTVVLIGDPHMGPNKDNNFDTDNTTKDELSGYVRDMIRLGKDNGKKVVFSKAPKGYVPTCDLAICLGDMDPDKPKNAGSDFTAATTTQFDGAGIPFITLLGNHDMHPDYYNGDNPSRGVTYGLNDGGAYYDGKSIAIMDDALSKAQKHGVSNVKTFIDSNYSGSSYTQVKPFTFTFNGVRFYIGQTYWFQKIYKNPGITSSVQYYAPDNIIQQLETFVGEHANEPSVWMQHYPFVFGSDCDRWWLDQNTSGKNDAVANTAYPSSQTYMDAAAAKVRKDKLAEIINQTKNPVHFSGHVHEYGTNTYAGITDYSVVSPARHDGQAMVVLCKEGKGVVEVQQITFNNVSE